MAPATKKAKKPSTKKATSSKSIQQYCTPASLPANHQLAEEPAEILKIEPSPTSPDIIIGKAPRAIDDIGVTADELAAIEQVEFDQLMQ